MSSIDKKAFGLSDSLINAVNEALKGGQVKIDKNHNGKIDGQDFKMLRKEEVPPGSVEKQNYDHKMMKEGNPANKEKKNAAAAAVGAKNRDSQYLSRINPSVADKIRGREKMSGNDRQQHEEVEQVDEISSTLLHKAKQVAQKKAGWLMPGDGGKGDKAWNRVRKFRDAGVAKEKQEKAVKEEVVDEERMSKGRRDALARKTSFTADPPRRLEPEQKKTKSDKMKAYRADRDKHMEEEVEQINEIGDTKRGQKLINKVHKRASERLGKAVANKDPKNARKYQEVGHQAWDRMPSNKYEEVEHMEEAYDDNSSNVSDWSDKKLKWHKEKLSSSSAKAHSELVRRSKTGQAAPKKTNEETDPGFVAEVQRRADVNMVKVRMPDGSIKYKKVRAHTAIQHEANDAVSNQIAAKKDAFKTQLQQKIASKQMNVMQAKANKRLSNINASNDKCTCQEGKGKSMTCEMHGDTKKLKGGKEPIETNPPLREAQVKTK